MYYQVLYKQHLQHSAYSFVLEMIHKSCSLTALHISLASFMFFLLHLADYSMEVSMLLELTISVNKQFNYEINKYLNN